ncbi:MAG: YdcF family protein [Gammaproteobacteria bacterium]
MEVLLNYAAGSLLLPPGSSLVLLVLAWAMRRRLPRAARALAVLAVGTLWLLATPYFAGVLQASIAGAPALDPRALRDAQAIVVLGGGRVSGAPEYGGRDVVSRRTMVRLQYAVLLQRQSNLPVAVSGGSVFDQAVSEAELMRTALEDWFRVPVRWLEPRSRNTAQNAMFTHALLAGQGIRRIVLVTEGLHMRRAAWSFRRAGFEVIAAPTLIATEFPPRGPLMLMPDANALRTSSDVLHEWIGLAWYRVRYWRAG